MSLSRSPSPHRGGGWSSPGLTPGSGVSSPRGFSPMARAFDGVSWNAAKVTDDDARKYPSFTTRNNGFFSRQKRRISARIPSFRGRAPGKGYVDKDVYGRGVLHPMGAWRSLGLSAWFRIILRRGKMKLLLGLLLLWLGYLLLWSTIIQLCRGSPLGGGSKFVIILASNVEGGVMELKGAREWAVERNSIRNKRKYANRWGYKLEIANMLAKKRYSHEWRESWEKVDVIRETMRKNPQAEWFWWLDLNTWIMESRTSLQDHIFNNLESHVYRDINEYNPLNITHPPPEFYLDELERTLATDSGAETLHLLLSQDCSGFNLGSFFLRRSVWTERLLDTWWDPVMYEQMHSRWEHKEQTALEYIYQSQPWVRNGVGFLPQRRINSFPLGACGDENNPAFHYQEADRDFVVNMAGCMFGRDCWTEIYTYRAISREHNRSPWDGVYNRINSARAQLFGYVPEVE